MKLGDYIDWPSVILITIALTVIFWRLGKIAESSTPIYHIHVSSPYDPEDGFTWREFDNTYLTCFPVKE